MTKQMGNEESRMEKEDAHRHFGKQAETYGSDYRKTGHTKYPANRYRLNIVKDILLSLKPHKILDIGCGTGDPLIEINGLGFDIDGFDFSEEMVRFAKQNVEGVGLSSETVFRDDMEDPQRIESGKYDCMIALGSVYYARNFEQTMSVLTEKLRPGGSFIFSLRNDLFALFSMNQYTVAFLLDQCIPSLELSPDIKNALIEDLNGRFGAKRDNASIANIDSANVHSASHNPLTVEDEVLHPRGMILEKTYYYHYHALPPRFEAILREEFRAHSAAMERPSDWRGLFMASGFVVHARKPADNVAER